MAVRYVEIGQYPDVRREVRGKLSEILVATANPGTYAAPEDVTGTFLEIGADGLWTGASVGALTQAQADALVASGVLANVKTATPATVNGQQVTWGGAGVGWVLTDLAYTPSSALGPNLYDGVEAQINTIIDDDGIFKPLDWYATSNKIPVNPGDRLILALAQQGLTKLGGYFLGNTWVSKIAGTDSTGYCVVPSGCDNIVVNTYRKVNVTTYSPPIVCRVMNQVGTKSLSSLSSIGDSICRGYRCTRPFTKVVADRLGITTINNNGIDSSTITQSANNPISARMSQLKPADIVLFEGGGNDFNLIPATLGTAADTTNTTFYGALFVCAEYIRKNFPLSVIVWVSVPRWRFWNTPNSNNLTMTAYMDAFKEIALRYGFVYADCYNTMSIDAFPAGAVIASDSVHPNDIGHQQIADIIIRSIGR